MLTDLVDTVLMRDLLVMLFIARLNKPTSKSQVERDRPIAVRYYSS